MFRNYFRVRSVAHAVPSVPGFFGVLRLSGRMDEWTNGRMNAKTNQDMDGSHVPDALPRF
jgi:hypothetical protein